MEKNIGAKRRVAFKTLGCRLNQYETDALVSQFFNAGYEIVDFGEKADVTVINTCTVTNQSDQKSRNYISQAARINPSGISVVAGCMVNHHKEKLEKQDNITYVVENENKNSIFSLVDAHFKGEIKHPEDYSPDIFGFQTVEKSLHTRTSIKVQDGCDNFCTFCIIPKVRGRATSRPVEEILENIRQVTANGFREIVITGVNIGRYNFEGTGFPQLLEKIIHLPGDFRVRISSIEPDGFTDEMPELFLHEKLAPHLHLCLQSGSDPILLKMRRMYTVSSFMKIVENFRKRIPDFNFTTDIIVGFPGESEEDFLQSLKIAREAYFSHIHTFRYSVRNTTRAARMENQIPEKVKAERSARVRELSAESELRYLHSMLGKTQMMLTEKKNAQGYFTGYGENYVPLQIPAENFSRNRFVPVRLKELKSGDNPFVIAEILYL